jgi:flagellar protein FliO/FliZ
MDAFASSVARMLAALVVVLLAAAVSLRFWQRLRGRRAVAAANDRPRFMHALPVGARERVVVMHYRGEEWVLGVTAGGISLLARQPLSEAAASCPDRARGSS